MNDPLTDQLHKYNENYKKHVLFLQEIPLMVEEDTLHGLMNDLFLLYADILGESLMFLGKKP